MERPLEDNGATEAAERGLERYSAFGAGGSSSK
jgi:hypothetical protein